MENRIPPYLVNTAGSKYNDGTRRVNLSFLDKTIINSSKTVKSIYLQAEYSSRGNFIQMINPNVKLIALIYMAVVISFANSIIAQGIIAAFVFFLYIIAQLKIFEVYRKIFFLAFIFGFLVVLPASLNVITGGDIIINLATFKNPAHFLIYSIPQSIGITDKGIQVVAMVFLRVLNSVSFALLVVFTTPFPSLVKSLKMIGVPDTFLMIISLAYKYIFILSRTIEETYSAFKSRLSGNIKNSSIRGLVGGRILFIFRRSMIIYQNTFQAMVSRGYTGKVVLHSRNLFTLRDVSVLVIIVAAGIVFILI